MITYTQYSKLSNAVTNFNNAVNNAKTSKEAIDAYNEFILKIQPFIQTSQSHAFSIRDRIDQVSGFFDSVFGRGISVKSLTNTSKKAAKNLRDCAGGGDC